MAFDFFKNAINIEANQLPNQMYRDLEQAFITQQWDNTSTRFCIKEQKMQNGQFDWLNFKSIDVWINYAVGDTTTGLKNGDDFRKLSFECIDHDTIRGRYYLFDDNYWITTFTNQYDALGQEIIVRRCNNALRIVDPENGAIFSAPCVVDYDMSSPSVQVSSNILTPNNHAVVIVQANANTLRLFKTNTRYILGGRPFKLYGYQNTMLKDLNTPMPTLLYLDLYLDEIHANDDIQNQLAYNGEYDYQINIVNGNMNLKQGATGLLEANVLLNGIEVDKIIEWSVDKEGQSVVALSGNNYTIIGETGQAVITAKLLGNDTVEDSITIQVVGESELQAEINITPAFDTIREFETVEFVVQAIYDGRVYEDIVSQISLVENENVLENNYLSIVQNNNLYQLSCKQRTSVPQVLYITVSNQEVGFEANAQVPINLVSMFG